MRQTLLLLLVVPVMVVATVTLSAAGPDAKYKAPRTESGRPDLQGVWNFSSGVPLQRPAAVANRTHFTKEEFDTQRAAMLKGLLGIAKFAPVEAVAVDWIDNALHVDDLRTSLITYPANGRLPALVEGVQRLPTVDEILGLLADAKGGFPPELLALFARLTNVKRDSYENFSASERCISGAVVPLAPALGENYVQIIQSRDHVALVTDEFRRIVTLETPPQMGEKLRNWDGVSRGHWDGETLVIETRNFNSRTPSFAGAGNAHDKVVTERISRTSQNTIEYAAAVADPKTFQDKVEFWFPMVHVDTHIFESACHEGNYSLTNTLSAVRTQEAATR
jgi:hypothetical protein